MKKHSEEHNQVFVAAFLKKVKLYNSQNNLPDFEFWHTPNGGYRSKAEGGRLKLMGVRAGVLDLEFIWGGGTFFIELKDTAGHLSKDQLSFMESMNKFGVKHYTVYSDTAPDMITQVGNIILELGLTNQNGISKSSEEALSGWVG